MESNIEFEKECVYVKEPKTNVKKISEGRVTLIFEYDIETFENNETFIEFLKSIFVSDFSKQKEKEFIKNKQFKYQKQNKRKEIVEYLKNVL